MYFLITIHNSSPIMMAALHLENTAHARMPLGQFAWRPLSITGHTTSTNTRTCGMALVLAHFSSNTLDTPQLPATHEHDHD
jgi:hypothetical protein